MNKIHFKTLIKSLALVLGIIVLFGLVRKTWFSEYLEFRILSKIILALVSVGFILKHGFGKILKSGFKLFSIWVLVSIVLIAVASFEMKNNVLPEEISKITNIKFLVFSLSTGFFEEIFFRVFVFYFILKSMKNKSHSIWKATIWTSVCFGLVHLTNYFKYFDIPSTISVIIFATLMGFAFQAMYLRTRSVIFVAVLHGLVNYFGSYRIYLLPDSFLNDADSPLGNYVLSTLLAFGIMFIVLVLPARWYIKNRARIPEEYLEKI